MSPSRVRGGLGLAAAGAALLAVCACASSTSPAGKPAATGRPAAISKPAATSKPATTSKPAAISKPAASSALTLNDWALAGQHVIYSYSGLTAPSGLLQRIRLGQVAGVIFFGSNISSTTQIASVIKQFEQAASSSPVKAPLLLEVDQEGGLVRRLPGAPLLSEKQIGQSTDPGGQAASAGTGAGSNLLSVGMNVNLAPVVDFYRQAGDFYDQFQRSYSMSASTAGALSADFVRAQQATGVAATAKHFPGLASASSTQNTDLRPVTLNDSSTRITSLDELPYKSAIAAGVKIVMPNWASYPNIGSKRPAGLSSKVVQGQLRRSLGFTGVIETDAIGAGGLSQYGGHGNRSILATIAGDDLVLSAGQSVNDGVYITSKLVEAYRNATVDRTAFQASAQRVISLRSSLPG
jgi:beta-N-acetylhexosaminidase